MCKIDMILDGGEVGIGLESTIIDLTVNPPQILRPGYITEGMLEKVLESIDMDVTIMDGNCGQPPRAPGMKYRHYAPKGELTIVTGVMKKVTDYINGQARQDALAGEKVGIIATRETLPFYHAEVIKSVGSREDEESIARRLYIILREFDEENVTKIYSESFEARGLGQ